MLTQTPPPAELVAEVVTRSPDEPSTDRERGMGVQCSSAPTAKAGWCWWGGFAAWARRHWGRTGELFTGPLNRTGPLEQGFSASHLDAEWGLQKDAWAQDWDAHEVELWLGNPPYHGDDIQRFCKKAQECRTDIFHI